MQPKVLLLDEPFGALDALTRARLQDELVKIVAATGSTVLMVTHDVDEAVLLSDRIVMMTNGPAATIGGIVKVELPRPADRIELAEKRGVPPLPDAGPGVPLPAAGARRGGGVMGPPRSGAPRRLPPGGERLGDGPAALIPATSR
jgi:energy-coupling factor transporter ATP-binding protein EcfA2